MANKNINWESFSLRTVIISLLLSLFGMALIAASYIMAMKPVVNFTVGSIGTTALTIGVISFFYEILLRRSFIDITQQSLRNILEEEKQKFIDVSKEEREKFQGYFDTEKNSLIVHLETEKEEVEKALQKIIIDSMPPKYVNIKRVGIVDAYDFLEIEKLRQKIERLENTEFKILKIWTPTLNLLESTIISAIDNNNVTFRIALLTPNAKEAIEKRAMSLKDYDPDQVIGEIIKNLRRCKSIYNRLKNKDNFQVRLYDAFISIPIYGYGTSYIMGLYLHNRLSEEGVQIKVSSVGSKLYKKLDEHFEAVWNISEEINFSDDNYLKKIIDYTATNTVQNDNSG